MSCLLLALLLIASNRGAVVCFLEEEQVACVTEDKLVGDPELQIPDSIVKVKWSDKECYKARVIFYGNTYTASI